MKPYYINGIQQIGIGNNDVEQTYNWYDQHFGMKVKVFDEEAEAALMLPYTGGVPRKRHAILALNLNGGGGVELWQYTERLAVPPKEKVEWGDLGILASCFKSRNIEESYATFENTEFCSPVVRNPLGQKHFYTKDLHGNLINVIESNSWFKKSKNSQGGICGAVIGVSNMDESLKFYKDFLHYDVVLADCTEVQKDYLPLFDGQESICRRVILTHSEEKQGAFSELFGKTQIELVQRLDYAGKKVFANRLWGDLGYIHCCFDVNEMDVLKAKASSMNFTFTVDSGNFEMGNAAGRFAYVEDPDGTLIEFVETYEVPIVEKWGWSLKLRGKRRKRLPRWMIKAMGWL